MVDTLRRELSRLEAELRADPRSVKIAHIKELLAVYEKETPDAGREPRPQSGPEAQPGPARPNGAGKTKAALMEETVAGLLAKNGQMHRSAILKHLVSLGIMGHEKKPLGELAAFLSTHRNRFASDGNGNYRLIG